jgi:hypothetical protein
VAIPPRGGIATGLSGRSRFIDNDPVIQYNLV